MFEEQPRPLFPALRPLYASLETWSWVIVRCACGLILAVHGWGKISRGAEAMAPAFVKMGYEHPVALIYLLIFVEFVGGLASYGVNYPDHYRRAATFADKIFKGVKPADLPVEQPTKLELMINLKTARALGLTIPRTVMLQVDQVVE